MVGGRIGSSSLHPMVRWKVIFGLTRDPASRRKKTHLRNNSNKYIFINNTNPIQHSSKDNNHNKSSMRAIIGGKETDPASYEIDRSYRGSNILLLTLNTCALALWVANNHAHIVIEIVKLHIDLCIRSYVRSVPQNYTKKHSSSSLQTMKIARYVSYHYHFTLTKKFIWHVVARSYVWHV